MRRKPKAKAGSGWRAGISSLWHAYTGLELTLLIVGAISFIGVIVILFMPIGKGPDLITPTGTVPAAGSDPSCSITRLNS